MSENTPGQGLFTAAPIARGLGRTRPSVARLLDKLPPSGEILIRGNVAKVWSLAVIPTQLVAELDRIRSRRGFATIEKLLNAAPVLWAAPVSVDPVRPEFKEKAIMLRLGSGNFRRPDFTEDKKRIRNLAILHGGNESLAHRLCRQNGQLSAEFEAYDKFAIRQNKSDFAKTIRADILFLRRPRRTAY